MEAVLRGEYGRDGVLSTCAWVSALIMLSILVVIMGLALIFVVGGFIAISGGCLILGGGARLGWEAAQRSRSSHSRD